MASAKLRHTAPCRKNVQTADWPEVPFAPFVREMVPGVRAVLALYARHQKPAGPLGDMPWWNFVDWVDAWPRGVPPMEACGSAAPIDLELLLAYDWAADLGEALGNRALAADDRRAAAGLRAAIRDRYWDAGRKLFAATPRKADFSQYANVLAILAGGAAGEEARALAVRVLAWARATATSIFRAPGGTCWKPASPPGRRRPTRPGPTATPGAPARTTSCSTPFSASTQPLPASGTCWCGRSPAGWRVFPGPSPTRKARSA
jgi:hypothetical protein